MNISLMKWLPALCLLTGMVMGGVGVALIPSRTNSESTQAEAVRKDAEIARLQGELQRAMAGRDAAQSEKAALVQKVAEVEKKSGKETAPAPANAMASLTNTILQQRSQSQLLALKNRLNLNPAQEEALRKFLEEDAKWQQEITASIMAGKSLSAEEIKQRSAGYGSLADELKKILTPEQLQSYGQFQKEEKAQQQEMIAHHGLNEISSLFPLNDDQKDKVYGILYSQFDFKPDTAGFEPQRVPGEIARQQHDNTKEKLKEVLTAEQLEIWSKQDEAKLKSQEEMMKRFLPK